MRRPAPRWGVPLSSYVAGLVTTVSPPVPGWPRVGLRRDSRAPVLLIACARCASMMALRGKSRMGTTICTHAAHE